MGREARRNRDKWRDRPAQAFETATQVAQRRASSGAITVAAMTALFAESGARVYPRRKVTTKRGAR